MQTALKPNYTPTAVKPNYTAATMRSCCRCGTKFSTPDLQRVCWGCRKPAPSRRVASKPLTFRERQIVQLVSQGKANKEIAFSLVLTQGTVKEYLFRIFRKVEVSNRTELAIWALTRGQAAEDSFHEEQSGLQENSLVV